MLKFMWTSYFNFVFLCSTFWLLTRWNVALPLHVYFICFRFIILLSSNWRFSETESEKNVYKYCFDYLSSHSFFLGKSPKLNYLILIVYYYSEVSRKIWLDTQLPKMSFIFQIQAKNHYCKPLKLEVIKSSQCRFM